MTLADMLEKDWQRQVVDLALLMGWHRPYHVYDSRRSEPGWPDLCLVRDRFVFLELKREKGTTSHAQRVWITRLTAANAEVYVCRPSHLQPLSAVLHARGPVHTWSAEHREARGVLLVELDNHLLKEAAA